MIIPLNRIIKEFTLDIRGVIHIGAHWGTEYQYYADNGIENMVFFEPIKSNYQRLVANLPIGVKCFNMALGSSVGTKEMYVESDNQGQSCSVLEPGTHLKSYPHIRFNKKETVIMTRLDDVKLDRSLYNMINIDVQGYELEVFWGATETLETIDIIYAEVNFEEVYKNCCRVEDLDGFLLGFGFNRVLTEEKYRKDYGWGDALYLKALG